MADKQGQMDDLRKKNTRKPMDSESLYRQVFDMAMDGISIIDEDGVYIVSCPQLKGCHSQGKTIDEALINIREVIDLCLEDISSTGPFGLRRC